MVNYNIKRIILSQEDFHLLPRDEDGYCVYDGNLTISNSDISILPDKLKVNGYINCIYNDIVSLPNGLYVKESLYCGYNKLTSIPSDLIVNGGAYCIGNNITTEIKCNSMITIHMDNEQRKQYERAIKLNKIITNIDG